MTVCHCMLSIRYLEQCFSSAPLHLGPTQAALKLWSRSDSKAPGIKSYPLGVISIPIAGTIGKGRLSVPADHVCHHHLPVLPATDGIWLAQQAQVALLVCSRQVGAVLLLIFCDVHECIIWLLYAPLASALESADQLCCQMRDPLDDTRVQDACPSRAQCSACVGSCSGAPSSSRAPLTLWPGMRSWPTWPCWR